MIENGFHHEVMTTKPIGNKLAPPAHLTLETPPSPSMRRFQERTKRVEVILNGEVDNGVVIAKEGKLVPLYLSINPVILGE